MPVRPRGPHHAEHVPRPALRECVDPKDFQADAECGTRHGSGVLPESDEDDLTHQEIRPLGFEPIPPGHPALENEQWSPTYGGGNRTRSR